MYIFQRLKGTLKMTFMGRDSGFIAIILQIFCTGIVLFLNSKVIMFLTIAPFQNAYTQLPLMGQIFVHQQKDAHTLSKNSKSFHIC